jgi:choline dehydrogenase-like flavoprotein
MLRSLSDLPANRVLHADVAVIGGGLAGLILAERLAKKGHHVVVLESGGRSQSDDLHPLNSVETLGEVYHGAERGRFRCLGGTSTRWGGALLPYLASDLDGHPCGWHSGWKVSPSELAKYLVDIEAEFGVDHGSYEVDDSTGEVLPSFMARLPKWPLFQNRNTANLFRKSIAGNSRLEVWVDATVTEIALGYNSVTSATARSEGGNRIEVRTKRIVIAAGAIETTRLLLILDRSKGGRIFPPDSPLGKNFHDHISACIGSLAIADRNAAARLFSFRFVRGGMRNLRFELAPRPREQKRLPAAFLHVAFSRNDQSGFAGLREVYQRLQQRKLPPPSSLWQILKDSPWFANAVWWRFANGRVLPPASSNFELHLVTEQHPMSKNRIGLSHDRVDRFGQPLATISWTVSDEDQALFWKVAELAFAEWEEGQLAKLGGIIRRDRESVFSELLAGGGIYHPAGTTRIGSNASEGVVDDRLRVHGVRGLWALATSVFPSVGGSSPSLALTQFAARMADDINAELTH